MIIQNLSNLLIFLIQFKERTLLKLLGIKDPKSVRDILYFMDTEEYEKEYHNILSNDIELQKSITLNEVVTSDQTSSLSQIYSSNNVEVKIEPYADDLYLKTNGDIPLFPTADGFTPDYVQIVSAKNNDLVNLQTFQIIGESLAIKLKYGIGLNEIENILFTIAFIRFILLCFKYNIKTSFIITIIGISSCYIWYRHFVSISTQYAEILYRTPHTFKFISDLYDIKEYSKTYVFNFTTPYSLIWNAIKKAGFDSENLTYIDPIALIFSIIPKPLSNITDYIFYTVYRDLGPQFIMYGKMFFKESTSLATYMFFVRINKERCPYHIRWHWTCTLIISGLEYFYMPIIHRLTIWLIVLEPAYKASYNEILKIYTDLDLQNQYFLIKIILFTCVFSHLSFILYGMIQAICGQYFYIPFITENTELHIGKREKTIYSGGNTPWDERNYSLWNIIIPGYAWYRRQINKNKWVRKVIKVCKKILNQVKKNFK